MYVFNAMEFLFIIFSCSYLASGVKTYATLLAKEAREQWERHFNEAYIQPTLLVRESCNYKSINYFYIAYL